MAQDPGFAWGPFQRRFVEFSIAHNKAMITKGEDGEREIEEKPRSVHSSLCKGKRTVCLLCAARSMARVTSKVLQACSGVARAQGRPVAR